MTRIAIKTAERRIGVLGAGSAGKTVLLTSLINHLATHDPRVFHIGKAPISAQLRKFRRLPEDEGWPGFDYETHRERIVSQRWPAKTADRSLYSCQFERSDWKFTDVQVKFYDLPGDRIHDVAMVHPDTDNYAAWSDEFFLQLGRMTSYETAFADYRRLCDADDTAEADLIHSYKVALGRLRSQYKMFITPSTYQLDLKGTAARGMDPEQLAKERYVGPNEKAEFTPLPNLTRSKNPRLRERFENRFNEYRDSIVRPFIEAMQSCHGLIVLVDVLHILACDTDAYDDYQRMIGLTLKAINPKENVIKKTARILGEYFLPRQIRPSWISRIAFAAPKADLVHPDDRNRLKHLLRQVVERDARDLDGITWECFNLAAVRSTEAMPVEADGSRVMVGSTWLDDSGRKIDPGAKRRFVVSALPDEWPRSWKVGDHVFPLVYPNIPPRRGCPPDQFGLAEIFDFLCW